MPRTLKEAATKGNLQHRAGRKRRSQQLTHVPENPQALLLPPPRPPLPQLRDSGNQNSQRALSTTADSYHMFLASYFCLGQLALPDHISDQLPMLLKSDYMSVISSDSLML